MAEISRLYEINGVASAVIINDKNRAVQGFVITFTIIELNEQNTVEATEMDSASIDSAIREFITNRLNLQELGK